jgi:predicted dehydrogenase
MASTDRIRVGIVGAGRIARRRIAPAISRSSQVLLAAAASRDITRARSLGAQRSYDDYARLIDDPGIDMVYVATHNGLHAQLAIASLMAGKHVLCEKPLARNAQECTEILQAADASGLKVMEAFMYRYRPEIRKATELCLEGRIGDVMVVEASFRFPLTAPDDVRLRADWGGGALLDVGCYCVNVSRLFLGDSPTRVTALAALDQAHGVDRSVQGVLEYGDGKFAIISCGFESGLHQKVALAGTAGSIEINQPFVSRAGDSRLTVCSDQREDVLQFAPADPYLLEIDDFAHAVRTGSEPLIPAVDSQRNAVILDRLAASFQA